MAQGHNVEQEPRDAQGRWTKAGVVSVNLSPEIRAVLDSLRAAGGKSFIVGGSVRDAALGKPVKDTDIEVYHLDHGQLVQALSRHGVVDQVGKSFGVYKVRLSNGEDLDVSLPRRERKLGEGHRGFDVQPDPFMQPSEAAFRRDFTINSLMYDPYTGAVHDYHGGLADLKNKRLRHTGSAFGEDPLRVLRAMQFAGRFGFDLDPRTAQVAQDLKKEYPTIAKERIWTEWEKVAQKAKHPGKAIDVLLATGWIDFYPELKALDGVPQEPEYHPEGQVLIHTKYVMDEAARIADRDHLKGDQRTILILAALCHDFGKAIPGITQVTEKNGVQRITSYGHDDAGVDPSRSFLERIGCPLSLRQSILTLVKEHMAHTGVQANHRTVTRLAHRLDPVTVRDWERIVEADHSGRPPLPKSRPAKGWLDIAETLGASKGKVKPLIGGDMLIARGLKPGPQFKGILNAAYDAQMDKEVTAENAAGWLDRYLAEHGFVSSMKNKSQQPLLFLAKAEHDVSDEPRDKDGKWTKEPGSGIPTAAERAAYAKRVAENPQPGDTVFVGDKTMADYGDIYEVTKGAHENGLQNNLIKIRKSYWAEGKDASASLGVWQKYIKDGNLIPRMPGDVAPDPSPEMLKEIRKDCATKEVRQIKYWAYSGYMPSQVLEKTLNVLCLKPPKDFSFTLKAAVPGVSQLSTGKEWTVTEGPKTTSLKSKVTLTAKDGEKVTLSVKDWVKTARSGEVPFTVKQVTDLLPTKCQECGKEIQGKDIHACPFCSNEFCAADLAKHEETCPEKAVCAKCGKVMKKTDAVKCSACGKTFCVEHASAGDHDCPESVACSVCGHKTNKKYMTKDPTTGKYYCQADAEDALGAYDIDGDGSLGVNDIVNNGILARQTKDRLVRAILARVKDNPDFSDFLKDRDRLHYVLPGTVMALREDEPYQAVNLLIQNWATTSCDGNRLAIALQQAAAKEFKLPADAYETPWVGRIIHDDSSIVPIEVRKKAIADSEPALRAFLRAMYDNTQDYFARKGIKNVTLYRGFSYDTKGLEDLKSSLTGGLDKPIAAEAKLQPMSSFSTDVQTASTFTGDRGLAVVMETKDVPVKGILSTAMTGFGCLSEQEMVVLGNSLKPCLVGTDDAWGRKVTQQANGKTFWYDVLPKNQDVLVTKSEQRRPLRISVDRDVENADWTKQAWDLPAYKSKKFWNSLKNTGMDLAHFRTLPVFKHLFRRHGVTKSQQPLLLLAKAHDVSKEPRDKQGKWAKVNGLPADVQIDPGDQALHDLFHGDHFELTATPRKNDYYGDNDYVLSIKPRLDKRYHQEVPGSFADDPPKGWYDTRLAHVEKGEGHGIYQPHYVRLNSNLPAEYSENLPEKEEPGHIWRGLSWEEMQAIKKNGAIRSNGQYNIGDIQKGLTYFADDPQTAESYAGTFAPPASIPTFDRPSYLVKMADPGDNTAVRLPHIEGEVGLKGAIPANKIEAIYEMQPFNVDAGEYELRTDHGLPKPTFSKGSGSKPGADYVFRKVTDVPGFLQGKEGKMTKSFDPNQPRDERGRWTKLAQGELAGMAADAKKYKDFHDYALDWSVMGMRGQYWHLTSKKNFKIDSTYVPHEYASNAAGIEGDGRSGLMVSGDPEWWHQQLPRGRRWAAEIDLSHAIRNRDYTVTNRGFGAEVFISNPAAVSVKRVVPYKQAVQEAQHYTEVGPQSEEDLRDFWTAVNKTTVPAAKSHQSLVLLNKPLPEVGDEVRIRNFRHPLSPYPLIVHGVGNDGNVQVRRLDTPKGALVSVPLKHLLLTRRAVHRKNDKPQSSSGFPNPYAAMAGYLDTTKSHDVSQEPRDEKGRWTAVGRLVHHLQQNKSPELHELVDNVHWGLGPSGVMPAKARRTYIDYTQDGLLAARETGYSRNQDAYYKTKDVIQKLDEQDQDTLERLIRGDIPAEWGHDPAYIDHLKKWGNGSKLLDDEGVPYRLYHGTPSVFRAFDPTKRGSSTHMSDAKKAFFFTGSPEDAGFFSFFPVMQKYDDFQSVREGKNPAESGTPNVMPVHVRLRKPLVLVDESGAMDMELLNGALDLAHRKGYDGIVMYVGVSPIEDHLNEDGEWVLPFKKVGSVKATGMSTSIYDPGNAILPRQSNMVVCAFNPVDVKSALGDNGNFDESSDLGKSHELLLLSKSGHDVSGEPRDKDGRWTAMARLDSNLKRKRLGSLDTLVRTLIDDTNSNRLGPQGYFYNIAGVSESDYDPEVPYTSSPDTIATVRQLDSQDRDTLRRLVYGDIPVSRGHDAVYLDHLRHWAEGSKLVDQEGLPYRVFHGSDAGFRAFSLKKRGNATHYQDAKRAFFFAASPTDASRFATLAYHGRKNPGKSRAPQVYATYVRLKKPLVVIDSGGAMSAMVMRQALDYAADHGHDGVVMYEQDRPAELFSAVLDKVGTAYDSRGRASSMYSTGGTLPRGGDMVVAVTDATDVKSATGNRGTFDDSSDLGKSHDVSGEPRNKQGEWATVAHDNHHGSMAGKRGIDPTVPYWVYLNLHLGTKKPLLSKKTGQPVKNPKTGKVLMVPDQKVWSMKNWKTGLVDQHTGTVYLKDVRMHIGQAGRRKVIQTGTKNVHAGVVGMVVKPEEAPVEGWQELHYNPKDHPELAHGFFMLADPRHPDQRISHAKYVRFTPQGTQVWGPTYKKGPHDDDLYLGSEANGPRAQKGVSHILAQVEPVATTKSLIFLEKSATRRRTVKRPGSRGGVGFRDVHGNWRYGRQKPGQPGPSFTPSTLINLFRHMPQDQNAKQPWDNERDLYGHAKEAEHELEQLLDKAVTKLQLDVYPVGHKPPARAYTAGQGFIRFAPIKGAKRASEKMEEYGGHWNRVLDIVRASVAVNDVPHLWAIVEGLKRAGATVARQPKNRFLHPTPAGYRDALLNVRLPDGMVAEVQLHLKPILQAKAAGHKQYEAMREIEHSLPQDGRMTSEQAKQYSQALRESKQIYDAAWQKAVGAVVTKSEGEPEGYRYYQMNSGALIRHRDNEQPEMFHPVHRTWVPYQHLVDFAYKATPVLAAHANKHLNPTTK